MFIYDVKESFKMILFKLSDEDHELPLPDESELNLSDEQKNKLHLSGMLEMEEDYKVTIFTKWLYFVIAVLTFFYSIRLLLEGNLLFIIIIAVSIFMFKLHINRARMAEHHIVLIAYFEYTI